MKMTKFARAALAVRKDCRDRERAGYEFVGEGGGRLWELERGRRIGHRIVEVHISACGRGLWVKTELCP